MVEDLCRRRLLGYAESFLELADSYNDKYEETGENRQSVLEERRGWETRKVLSENLSEVARIMARVAREEFQYQPMESWKNKLLTKALRDEGIGVESICYLPGKTEKKVIGMTLWTLRRGNIDAEDVADMLSVLLHRPMQVSLLSPYVVESDKKHFVFVEEAKYMVLTGFSKVVREKEAISGDNYAFLESEKGKLTILLSDGTGSGEKASKNSGQVLDILEKMLESGYDIEKAMDLINSALYVKSEDCNHPTLDVCQLDLHQATCEFYKVGAAISFLKRGKQVEVIRKGNLPLGIFRKADAGTWSGKLEEGDYIIMMSDGVLDAFGQEDYEDVLRQTIEEMEEQHPGELAEKLLHMAICTAGGHIADDMTVLVAGIWENSGIT